MAGVHLLQSLPLKPSQSRWACQESGSGASNIVPSLMSSWHSAPHSRILNGGLSSNNQRMPPLTATAVLAPVKERDVGAKDCATNFCQDNWLEKVDGVKTAKPQKLKHNFIQRALENLMPHHCTGDDKHGTNAYDGPSYKEELQQYIAEATANLRYGDDEPLDSSDEDTTDGDCEPLSISPRNAEIIDFSESIVSMDEYVYVTPPVEVPRSYRKQDQGGGVLVAGERVLFTNWAFKRQMRHMGRLGPLPERGEAASYQQPSNEGRKVVRVGVCSGKTVEL